MTVVPPASKPLVTPVIPVSTSADVDPETLDMQKKLITKRKQLLELQQKKLELELLQTQVRLQEQRNNSTNTSNVATSTPAVSVQLFVSGKHVVMLIVFAECASKAGGGKAACKYCRSKQAEYGCSVDKA